MTILTRRSSGEPAELIVKHRMKRLIIYISMLVLTSLAGCTPFYSVEQLMVERGYRWIRRGEMERAIATFEMTLKKYPQSVFPNSVGTHPSYLVGCVPNGTDLRNYAQQQTFLLSELHSASVIPASEARQESFRKDSGQAGMTRNKQRFSLSQCHSDVSLITCRDSSNLTT